MALGRLNRQITIERKTTTPDRFGSPVESWNELATVWADAQTGQPPPKELFDDQSKRVVAFQYLDFTTHHTDVIEIDRVRYEGRIFDIEGIAKLPRRQLKLITSRNP